MKVICPNCKEKNDIKADTNTLVMQVTCSHCDKPFKRIMPKRVEAPKKERVIVEKKREEQTEPSHPRVEVGPTLSGNPGSMGIHSGPMTIEQLKSLGVPVRIQ